MRVSTLLARGAAVAAFGAILYVGSAVRAADAPGAPAPVYAAPPGYAAPAAGDPGCESCTHGVAGGCATCKKYHPLRASKKVPYQVNLCPGSCFGYFQTQWRRWDEVCPHPYIGQGLSDAPAPPGRYAPSPNRPRTPGSELDPPRTLDPKVGEQKGTEPKAGEQKAIDPKTGLPVIPPAPPGTGKFNP